MAHLPPLESDPVLASVQKNLSMGGGEISAIVRSGAATTGNDIMNVIHLMASGQSHAAPVSTAAAPSSAGPAVGGVIAGVAAGVAVGAMAYAGSKGGAKVSQPPSPPAELPGAKPGALAAPVTTTATPTTATKDPIPPPGGGKVPEPPTSAKLPDAGKYTITLSPDAAKNLPINPDNVDTSSGKVKVTPTPTSLTAIPYSKMAPADAEKKGFQKVTYNGADYWLSKQDMNIYAAWNKAYATTGGLKPDAATVAPVAVPIETPKSPGGTPPKKPLPSATGLLSMGPFVF